MESARSPVAVAAVTCFVQQSLEKFGTNFSQTKVSEVEVVIYSVCSFDTLLGQFYCHLCITYLHTTGSYGLKLYLILFIF
jgi:hypothetical protein